VARHSGQACGLAPGVNLTEVWRSYTTLTDRHAQMAFVNTVRSVIDVAGQRVSATTGSTWLRQFRPHRLG